MSKLSDSARVEEAHRRLDALKATLAAFAVGAPILLTSRGVSFAAPSGAHEDAIRTRAQSIINARITALEAALIVIDVDPAA